MNDYAIQVHQLSKQFRIGRAERYPTLRDNIVHAMTAPFMRARRLLRGEAYGAMGDTDIIWALRDVSFSIQPGEVVGIIGRNGAGKSTLLKILSQITEPTTGEVQLRGRIGALLEVGTGFHMELTGRENIYLNGAILGMRRAEIAQKFDEIVAFAGVETFIDTPVKHYSTGMGLRLGFAVAAHLEPDVLVVDEVLAVGDAEFQKRCLGKMSDVASSGRTVLFVSHNMAAVENLCQRGIVLESGQVVYDGSQTQAILEYLKRNTEASGNLAERQDRTGSGEIRIQSVEIRDGKGLPLETATSGQDIDIVLHYTCQPGYNPRNLNVSISVRTQMGQPLFLIHNRMTGDTLSDLSQAGAFVLRLSRLSLTASSYVISFSVMDGYDYIDRVSDALTLNIVSGDYYGTGEIAPSSFGPMLVDGQWHIEPEDSA